nr:MAG TPA_asm: hypothetical protein [Caudoviricetes sp.]
MICSVRRVCKARNDNAALIICDPGERSSFCNRLLLHSDKVIDDSRVRFL